MDGVAGRGARARRGGTGAGLIARILLVGFAVGAVVGGIGGRVAMRIITITSDDRLRGMLTDDDATVNQFTLGGTAFLVIGFGVVGTVLAMAYAVGRHFLPADVTLRAAAVALLSFGILGSGIFEPDGFDFTLLSPTWLSVPMFTAILLAAGGLLVVGVERVLGPATEPPLPLRATGIALFALAAVLWIGPTAADVVRIVT